MIASALTSQNLRTEQINQRAMDGLALATGQTQLVQPDQWWGWWDDQNETVHSGAKPTIQTNLERDILINQDDPYSPPTVEETEFHDPIPRTHTPVLSPARRFGR